MGNYTGTYTIEPQAIADHSIPLEKLEELPAGIGWRLNEETNTLESTEVENILIGNSNTDKENANVVIGDDLIVADKDGDVTIGNRDDKQNVTIYADKFIVNAHDLSEFKTINGEEIYGYDNIEVGTIRSISINDVPLEPATEEGNIDIKLRTINGNAVEGEGDIEIAAEEIAWYHLEDPFQVIANDNTEYILAHSLEEVVVDTPKTTITTNTLLINEEDRTYVKTINGESIFGTASGENLEIVPDRIVDGDLYIKADRTVATEDSSLEEYTEAYTIFTHTGGSGEPYVFNKSNKRWEDTSDPENYYLTYNGSCFVWYNEGSEDSGPDCAISDIHAGHGGYGWFDVEDGTPHITTIVEKRLALEGSSGGGIEDVRVNNTSVVTDNVANIKMPIVEGTAGSSWNSAILANANNVASGHYATAFGHGTFATGEASHAEGCGLSSGEGFVGKISAENNGAHAEGYAYADYDDAQITASGEGSHAEGYVFENAYIEASGAGSHAEGYAASDAYIKATGNGSHAEGYCDTAVYILASGDGSHAEGGDVIASGNYSHAEGLSTRAEGINSHAEGWGTHANSDSSHSEGYQTYAEGNYSHAEGHGAHANSIGSHAEGYTTNTYGNYSHAEGVGTSTPKDSAAIDQWNDAHAAHAEGNSTLAGGSNSHAEGNNTVTNNPSEHAEGQYNISHRADDFDPTAELVFGDSKNTIHSVGIGKASPPDQPFVNNKNAVEVMQNGDVYIIGIGDYDGKNINTAKTVQQVVEELELIIATALTDLDDRLKALEP